MARIPFFRTFMITTDLMMHLKCEVYRHSRPVCATICEKLQPCDRGSKRLVYWQINISPRARARSAYTVILRTPCLSVKASQGSGCSDANHESSDGSGEYPAVDTESPHQATCRDYNNTMISGTLSFSTCSI